LYVPQGKKGEWSGVTTKRKAILSFANIYVYRCNGDLILHSQNPLRPRPRLSSRRGQVILNIHTHAHAHVPGASAHVHKHTHTQTHGGGPDRLSSREGDSIYSHIYIHRNTHMCACAHTQIYIRTQMEEARLGRRRGQLIPCIRTRIHTHTCVRAHTHKCTHKRTHIHTWRRPGSATIADR